MLLWILSLGVQRCLAEVSDFSGAEPLFGGGGNRIQMQGPIHSDAAAELGCNCKESQ